MRATRVGRQPMADRKTRELEQIGVRLKALRFALHGPAHEVGFTRTAGLAGFCARLGIPVRTWQGWESGSAMPIDVVLRLIVTTSVSPRWLLTGAGSMFGREPYQAGAECRPALEQVRALCDVALAELDGMALVAMRSEDVA